MHASLYSGASFAIGTTILSAQGLTVHVCEMFAQRLVLTQAWYDGRWCRCRVCQMLDSAKIYLISAIIPLEEV